MSRENREYFTMETSSNPIVLYEDVKFKWLHVWERLDIFSDGRISASQMKNFLLRSKFADDLEPEAITSLLIEADLNRDGYISKEEFLNIIKDTRRTPVISRLLRSAAFLTIPNSGRNVRVRKYIDEYSCWPPPLFMFTITLAEISAFIYYGIEMEEPITARGPVPFDSPLIYDPKRRYEAWRFITYMFIHSGWVHLLNNMLMQMVLGVILELVHKWWRVMLVYSAGVIAGCLASSITNPYFYLAGASGGVYALEYAYLGNLILNWSEMSYPIVQATGLGLISILDVSFAIWDTYSNPNASNTSYMAHLGGALAGLLMGVNVLRNLKNRRWEQYCWTVSLILLLSLVAAAIGFHIAAPDYFPSSEFS